MKILSSNSSRSQPQTSIHMSRLVDDDFLDLFAHRHKTVYCSFGSSNCNKLAKSSFKQQQTPYNNKHPIIRRAIRSIRSHRVRNVSRNFEAECGESEMHLRGEREMRPREYISGNGPWIVSWVKAVCGRNFFRTKESNYRHDLGRSWQSSTRDSLSARE